MGTYKGNVGHLMQHWTLCELLETAQEHTSGLNFIDAHAMAPWATKPTSPDARFTNRRKSLPGQKSVYERAWKVLEGQHQDLGYPNSAAFVRKVWKKDYSLLLCEIDPPTINAINNWLPGTHQQPQCTYAKLFDGNWRDRFKQGLPGPANVDLLGDSLTLVSFDPNTCGAKSPQRRPTSDNPNIYPEDLELALRAMNEVERGILIQLCAYRPHRSNPQEAVIASFDKILTPCGFHLQAKVRPLNTRGELHERMMSLVYSRGVTWVGELAELPGRFEKWLRA